jgi:hypothetical protein
MNSEQTGEYIFSKMTSFSLLNFKFTQIFLMGQNDFSKITELSVNANFSFSEDYCYFHTSNTIRLNFNKFHYFLNFLKIDGTSHLQIFCSPRISNRCTLVGALTITRGFYRTVNEQSWHLPR